jgi:hypothetical protein
MTKHEKFSQNSEKATLTSNSQYKKEPTRQNEQQNIHCNREYDNIENDRKKNCFGTLNKHHDMINAKLSQDVEHSSFFATVKYLS